MGVVVWLVVFVAASAAAGARANRKKDEKRIVRGMRGVEREVLVAFMDVFIDHNLQ